MHFFRKLAALWLASGCSLLLPAQQTESLTQLSLAKAIDIGLKNAYQLQSAQKDVEIADQRLREIRGIGLPQASFNGSFNYFIKLPENLVPANVFNPMAPADEFLRFAFGTNYNANAGATVSQIIFSGEYLVGLQASRAYRDLQQAQMRKTSVDVREAVIRAYQLNAVLKETERLLQKNLLNVDSVMFQTSAYYREGFLESQDVDRLQLAKNTLENAIAEVKRQQQVAERLLKFQMGVDVNAPLSLSESFQQLIAAAESPSLLSGNFEFKQSMNYAVLQNATRLQQLEVKQFQAQALPTLAGFYNVSQNRFGQEFRDLGKSNFVVPGGTILGLQLNAPIFTGFTRSAKVKSARIKVAQLEITGKQAEQGYLLESETVRSNYLSALERLATAKKNVDLSERIMKTTMIKYREGVGSSIDYIQSQRDWLASQSEMLQIAAQLLDYKVSLEKLQNKY